MLTESPNPRTSRSAPALLLTRSGYRYSALELAFYPRTYSTAPRGMEENPMLCDLASREAKRIERAQPRGMKLHRTSRTSF